MKEANHVRHITLQLYAKRTLGSHSSLPMDSMVSTSSRQAMPSPYQQLLLTSQPSKNGTKDWAICL